jgi:hypothetical protein
MQEGEEETGGADGVVSTLSEAAKPRENILQNKL